MNQVERWKVKREYDPSELAIARIILEEVLQGIDLQKAVRHNPLPNGGGFVAKHALVAVYRNLVETGEWEEDHELLARIRMKPIRTLSGVTTITVLTKPGPCPGDCIFCPTEADMPQSYLPDEPGARRGLENNFDPYRQVSSRLKALREIGHPTEKIELLILGGSWTTYPRTYREWFVRRCFEALNEENPEDLNKDASLKEAQDRNVSGKQRNVGLVIETRPDLIDREELIFNRRLGVTKIQIGIQSMNNSLLQINHRGHTVEQSILAITLMRAAGFKIVAHWMPNLLGATLESDREDFLKLWQEKSINPDELKIYPCQLLRHTKLFEIWQQGKYVPYTEQELIHLLADLKSKTPRYCRINRIIRDIPSPNVIEGNRKTSLRQDVLAEMANRGTKCACIRCREIRNQLVDFSQLTYDDLIYQASDAEEHFLSCNSTEDYLLGFLRLSIPNNNNILDLPDLEIAAIIREIHVFGQSLNVGAEENGIAQHSGIGSRLIKNAEEICKQKAIKRLVVISAVGTRDYYSVRGFKPGELYMVKTIE